MTLDPKLWSRTSERIGEAIEIGGCDIRSLTQKFGTPLFVLDESDVLERISSWKREHAVAFHEHAGAIYYAAKAFIAVEIAKLIAENGLSLDVCTGGELAVAKAAGFPAERIEMHGNNKSESEIKAAYEELGAERFREGVPLHEVIQALILTKQHLIEFIRSRGLPGTALEIFGELELRTKANQFFDSAIYFMAAGYDREQAKASSHDHRAA